jgi:hypothetical protein
MRVDIDRSWLRGELFYDDELKPAPGNLYVSRWFWFLVTDSVLYKSISPGPITLASLMDPESYSLSGLQQRKNTEAELQMYDLFPMYPTCKSSKTHGILGFGDRFAETRKQF